jgi:hypothetical protein
LDGFWLVLNLVEVSLLWLGVFTLQVLSWGLSFSNILLDLLVLLLSGDDLSLASGWLDVRNSNVDLLLKDSAVVLFIGEEEL